MIKAFVANKMCKLELTSFRFSLQNFEFRREYTSFSFRCVNWDLRDLFIGYFEKINLVKQRKFWSLLNRDEGRRLVMSQNLGWSLITLPPKIRTVRSFETSIIYLYFIYSLSSKTIKFEANFFFVFWRCVCVLSFALRNFLHTSKRRFRNSKKEFCLSRRRIARKKTAIALQFVWVCVTTKSAFLVGKACKSCTKKRTRNRAIVCEKTESR